MHFFGLVKGAGANSEDPVSLQDFLKLQCLIGLIGFTVFGFRFGGELLL